MSENLWPKFDELDIPQSPISILRAQGEFLSSLTKSQVIGEVNASPAPEFEMVRAVFRLVAPSLDGYNVSLFDVYFKMTYPVLIKANAKLLEEIEVNMEAAGVEPASFSIEDEIYLKVKDEEAFNSTLKFLFSTDYVRTTVMGIIAHSRAISSKFEL